MPIDWRKIKREYINGSISYRALAKKHGVSMAQLSKIASEGNWVEARAAQQDRISARTEQKTVEKIAEMEADRAARLLSLGDSLAQQLELAIAQLDRKMVKSKEKVKTVKYDQTCFKPIEEEVKEFEGVEVVDGIIDRQGLQQLTAALKNLRDVMMPLQDGDADGNDSGVVILAPVKEDDQSGVKI